MSDTEEPKGYEHSGRRPMYGPGRQMKQLNVMVTDDHHEIAQQAGYGNKSKGVRKALELWKRVNNE